MDFCEYPYFVCMSSHIGDSCSLRFHHSLSFVLVSLTAGVERGFPMPQPAAATPDPTLISGNGRCAGLCRGVDSGMSSIPTVSVAGPRTAQMVPGDVRQCPVIAQCPATRSRSASLMASGAVCLSRSASSCSGKASAALHRRKTRLANPRQCGMGPFRVTVPWAFAKRTTPYTIPAATASVLLSHGSSRPRNRPRIPPSTKPTRPNWNSSDW